MVVFIIKEVNEGTTNNESNQTSEVSGKAVYKSVTNKIITEIGSWNL